MIIEYGYGAELKDLKLKETAYSTLRSMFGPSMEKTFASCYEEENEGDTEEEYFEFFCSYYENQTDGWTGIIGLIADIINENEFDGTPVFRTNFNKSGDALYVPIAMPEDETERSTMMTKQQVRKIITKYLSPLLDSGISFGYVDTRDI